MKILLLCFAQLFFLSCRSPEQIPTTPRGLIILDGARNIKQHSDYAGVVEYDVLAPFPATATIETLTSRLKRQGWTPINEERVYSGPGRPAPHELGWRTLIDGNTRVLTWTKAWQNDERATVEYNLTYRTKDLNPLHEPTSETLHIFATK